MSQLHIAGRRYMRILEHGTAWGILASAVALWPWTAGAQDKVSKPGQYSGYSPMLYQEVLSKSQYLVMRDGTKLAATIFRPAIAGKAVEKPYPVVWEGTTSRGRREGGVVQLRSQVSDLAKYGYVVVEVERRGLGASMGHMRGYHDWTESLDAFDITEWLATQPWSDGRVGVFGCSNTGEASLHAAAAMPPHLKAIFGGCYSWNKFDGFYRGGILANWGTGPQSNPAATGMANIPVDEDTDESMLKEAIKEQEASTSLLALWKSMPFRDSWSDVVQSRFWEEGSASTYRTAIERTGVGIYSFGGFYDDFRREQLVAFANLHNPSKVLLGPWGHCQNQDFDLLAERLRFFDYWLKGIENGIMKEPPIYYYTANAPKGSEWRFAAKWPLAEEKPTRYYLQAASGLSPRAPDAKTLHKDAYTVDYSVSCPAPVGLGQTCPLDAKGITYTTPALTGDLLLTGSPILHLWVSSTATDGNFFAYLEDVSPDNSVFVVTDGRLKASLRALGTPPYSYLGLPWHRSFQEDSRPLTPGQPAELVFDMLPLSRVFQAGHRVRITITGADPREKDRAEASPRPVVSIYRQGEHSSFVILPVISGGKGD